MNPDGRLIQHKARLCAYGDMQKWGVNYWDNYSPVVNWMYVRAMLTLSILIDLNTKSVGFVLDYTQADVKKYILMKLTICFGFEGAHPREWVIRLDKKYMA